jgi:hypothetical protein
VPPPMPNSSSGLKRPPSAVASADVSMGTDLTVANDRPTASLA